MDLEEVRKKKIEELKTSQQKQIKLQKQIQNLELYIKQYLTKEATSRYYTLKAAYPEKAIHVLTLLVQSIQQGKINGSITDQQFKELLKRLQTKREFKIRRK